MKRVLIGINSKYIHPAFGAHQIKTNCTFDIDLLEFTIKDNIDKIIDSISSYDIIAISTYIWNIEVVKKIIQSELLLNKTIILGGPEASFQFSDLLNNYNVKYIIKGEGEDSFNELLSYLNKDLVIDKVSNLYYFDETDNIIKFTFEKLPDINNIKHDYSLTNDFKNKICYLESSRGCYFNCSYCLASLEKPVRFFPMEEVKNNLFYLLSKKAKIIKFLDRSFNVDQNRMLEILKFINEYDNGYTTFQFEIVGDMLSDKVIECIQTMRKKFIRFEIGIQSTNNETIKAILRHQDFEKLKRNVERIKDYIVIHTDLICGLPYEDKETFKKSFNETFLLFTEELQLGFLKELKGTHISNNKDLYHYVFQDEAPYEVISNDFISYDDILEVKLVEKSLDKFYNHGYFKRTFSYIFQEVKLNPYDTFKDITLFIEKVSDFSKLQYDEITKLLYESIAYIAKNNHNFCKEKLFFLIKQDYLTKNKIKPKIWWDNNITRSEKSLIFNRFISAYPMLTKDILYKYSKLEKYKNEYFLVTYFEDVKVYYLKTYFAYCGFDCNLCPMFSTSDNSKCTGCQTGNYIFCNSCDIRNCNIKNNTENCGECLLYPCEKINKLSPDSKKILDIFNEK